MVSTTQLNPSAPMTLLNSNKFMYPDLELTESTNYRIKKIMDDEKILQDEIKFRNSLCKKYGRFSTFINGVEYFMIAIDIVVGTAATLIPGVGVMVSAAAFSGVGVISGISKILCGKLDEKKLKHYRQSVVARTTLSNLRQKISKAIIDGEISHSEFEDIQNIVDEWKTNPTEKKELEKKSTLELLQQEASEKTQRDLINQIKQMKISK